MHMVDDCSGDILEGVEKELRYAEECLKSNVSFRRSTPEESASYPLVPPSKVLTMEPSMGLPKLDLAENYRREKHEKTSSFKYNAHQASRGTSVTHRRSGTVLEIDDEPAANSGSCNIGTNRLHKDCRFTPSRAREQDDGLRSLDALLMMRNDNSRPFQARSTQQHDDSNCIVQVTPRLEPDPLDEPEDEGFIEKDQPWDINSETSGEILFASDVLCSPRGAVGRAEEGGIFELGVLENGISGHDARALLGGDQCAPGDLVVKSLLKKSRQRSSEDDTHRGNEQIRELQIDDNNRAAETDHDSLDLEHRRRPELRDETTGADEHHPGGKERTALSDEAKGSLSSQLEQREEPSPGHAARKKAWTDGTKKEGSEEYFSLVHGKRASAQSSRRTYIRGRPRVEELARSKRDMYVQREQQWKKMQEEIHAKECTFQPKIVPFSTRSSTCRAQRGCRDIDVDEARVPLHERLHKDARAREAARTLAQRHLESKILEAYTFQPELKSVNPAVLGQRPIHQRIWEIERKREQNLRLLEAQKEEREATTFAPPPLSRMSDKLARDARSAAARGCDREASRSRPGGRHFRKWREKEEMENLWNQYESHISEGTKRLVEKRPLLRAPFEQRQAMLGARKRAREKLRLLARAEEEREWFNPSIGRQTTSLLRRRMPRRLDETLEERVERMTRAEAQRQRKAIRERQQAEEEKDECTFRPSLNPVTLCVGQTTSLDELVNNRRGQRVRQMAQEKARRAENCTYKPSLVAEEAMMMTRNKTPQKDEMIASLAKWTPRDNWSRETRAQAAQHVLRKRHDVKTKKARSLYGASNKYRLNLHEPGRMEAGLRAREREQEEHVRTVQEEREVIEMQSCTFEPHINHGILRARSPVPVKGFDRYLALKDVAQRKELERQLREDRAFSVRPSAVRRTAQGGTFIEPFSLCEGTTSSLWWAQRRRRHEAQLAAQCTFRPWTVEGERNRDLSKLESLMLSDETVGGSYLLDDHPLSEGKDLRE